MLVFVRRIGMNVMSMQCEVSFGKQQKSPNVAGDHISSLLVLT
jgi:hypothetical protein